MSRVTKQRVAGAFRGRRVAGFTLIELLIVMAIIALLSGMILAIGALNRDKQGLRVAEAARGVERKLLEARNLAINTGRAHAVVFHIENVGQGRVLRNWDTSDARTFTGRHWCAVIGPTQTIRSSTILFSDLPRMVPSTGMPGWYGSAQRLAKTVESCQIGDKYYLPRGTRFLALGDAEDNLHNTSTAPAYAVPTSTSRYLINDWSVGTNQRTMSVSDASYDTYPRPWFGYLSGSGTAWTLNAWGGYEHAIFGSGLDYECTNRYRSGDALAAYAIVDSKNGAQQCHCYEETSNAANTPATNSFGEPLRPCCDSSQVNQPRPLVNGYWMDFAIVFLPNGQARCLTFYNRGPLYSQLTTAGTPDVADTTTNYAPNDGNAVGAAATSARIRRFYGRDDAIIVNESSVLGGTSITIGKDAQLADETAVFTSAGAALRSLLPLRRVVVNNTTGGIQVIKPYANIQDWLDDQERNIPAAQRIWANGWQYCSASDANVNKIRVSGALMAEMLTQHDPYPWIKPNP
jgi:prepilin-type N-terminal cleavage/methylation domain-containing protein